MRLRVLAPALLSLAWISCTGDSGGALTTGEATTSTTGTTGTTDGSTTGEPIPGFDPVACQSEPPDVLTSRLCQGWDTPETVPDKIFIDCQVEAACYGPNNPDAPEEIVVMAYNIERGVSADAQLDMILNDPTVPVPDVILLSEADRGCSRSEYRHAAWQYAETLGMNMVFGVEFVELPRESGGGGMISETCEHGNAVLSRFPIGNVEILRHEVNKSWYESDEPRLGGRVAVSADLAISGKLVHVAVVHFESGINDSMIRAAQAAEIADVGVSKDRLSIIGGDTNAGTYVVDVVQGTMNNVTANAFFERGFVDTHRDLPSDERATHTPGLILDLIFVRDGAYKNSGLCPLQDCDNVSDHAPIWTTIPVN